MNDEIEDLKHTAERHENDLDRMAKELQETKAELAKIKSVLTAVMDALVAIPIIYPKGLLNAEQNEKFHEFYRCVNALNDYVLPQRKG